MRVPYVRFTSFLEPRTADRLLDDIIDSQLDFRGRGLQPDGQPTFRRLNRPLLRCSELEDRVGALLPVFERRLAIEVQDAEIELIGQAYNDGGSFGRHNDAAAGGPNWRRCLSGIYYLHRRPRRFAGGDLAIYNRWGRAHLVTPEHNSAVFFGRHLDHEVLPVACPSGTFADSRFAVNIWISAADRRPIAPTQSAYAAQSDTARPHTSMPVP